MKIYCYYTSAYQVLIDEWFLPSVKREYDAILRKGSYDQIVDYKREGWRSITREKVEFIIKAIQDNKNDIVVFSDPDVQFVGETKKVVLSLVEGKDIIFQKDAPKPDSICTGFFVCKSNDKILRFWQDVRLALEGVKYHDDQDCGINFLTNFPTKKTESVLSRFKTYKTPIVKLSQLGLNPWRIKWGYLPVIFFGGGTLTGRIWEPGMDLPVPRDIVLHHANWTVGLNNKISQLQYVKKIVDTIEKSGY